jgi:hypothetical protein
MNYMNLIELLKQFKHVEPDRDFSRKSRDIILGSRTSFRANAWTLFAQNLEFGVSVALASLLIVMVVGGFSAWSILSPFPISNLDPAGLRAEAEAIDIQIRLTHLDYVGESSLVTTSSESTPQAILFAVPKDKKEDVGNSIIPPATHDNTSTPNPISIDEALQELAQ